MSPKEHVSAPTSERSCYRVGVDENGLGARVGPLVVTGVLARVEGRGQRLLSRKLPQALRADLDDSKALVSCHDISLGEAWARVVLERTQPRVELRSPDDLLRALLLDAPEVLQRPCPDSTRAQCWTQGDEAFEASEEQLERLRGHLDFLAEREVTMLGARTNLVCNGRLEELRQVGVNRFVADLHQMERLCSTFREGLPSDLEAVCGKVGGMSQYGRFFGPLSDRLHTVLVEGAAESAYLFPRLGTLRFVRDADASEPLVMLASLIGKYVRELTMRRIGHYYREQLGVAADEFAMPSGYHDPVSQRFVRETEAVRKRLAIVESCFLRSAVEPAVARAAKARKPTTTNQTELF
ncbi:MAG TPA: hypothetical protein VLC09_05575 [Polyangiaceae bacterium]|nr:hypothetical protein [Polyangiaceae bacterium]